MADSRMPDFDPVILSLVVATGIGLLVGTERERRKGKGSRRPSAGLRTFTIVAVTGAVSVIVGHEVLLAVTAGGTYVLTALALLRASKEDPGITTEFALVATALLGGLAVTQPALAAGIAVGVTIILNARSALHRFVRSVITADEVRDALIFAAATLIVLPLLPHEQIGPFGALDPHTIWIIVILVMAIGALGHIAVRATGPRFGLPLAGLASGFASSVATVGTMAARAKKEPEIIWPAAAGAALSSVATIIELPVLIGVTNFETVQALLVPLASAGAMAIAYGAILSVVSLQSASGEPEKSGPAFSLSTALGFAVILSAIILASKVLQQHFGAAGVMAVAAIAGFANVDPAAISVASLVGAGKLAAPDAVVPILVAFTTNTVTKFILGMFVGGAAFMFRVGPGLVFMVLAAWAGWWIRPS